jgi:hypothetical protein
MFRLRTQKLLVRGIFLAIGVLPLLVTVTWASLRNWQDSVDKLCDRWSGQLGLDVQVVNIEHPIPHVLRLEGVHITDPESGQAVLIGSSITISQKDNTTKLACRDLAVRIGHLPELWQMLNRQILRQAGVWGDSIELTAPKLKLLGADRESPLERLEIRIENSSLGREANLRIDWDKGVEPSTVRIVRKRQLEKAGELSVRIEIDTGPQPISCQLVPWPLDWLKGFGAEAQFRGIVWIEDGTRHPRGELAGHITQVDLKTSLGQLLPFQISGSVDLWVRSLEFENGRIQQLDARVQGGPISVDTELVTSLASEVGASLEISNASLESLGFDAVRFGIQMDNDGMRLRGLAEESAQTEALLTGPDAILHAPATQPVATTALIKAIVPDSSLELPINSTSEALMRVLPLGD